jgi:hypothetical protein
MKQHANEIVLSASDLVGHLNCGHLTELDFQVATGALAKPKRWDPVLEILRERGYEFNAKQVIDPLAAPAISFQKKLETSTKTGSPTGILFQQMLTALEEHQVFKRIADGCLTSRIPNDDGST